MQKMVVIFLVAVVFLGGAVVFSDSFSTSSNNNEDATKTSTSESKTDATKTDTASTNTEQSTPNIFTGEVLAGRLSPYFAFKQADYVLAQKQNKIIVLNFYANWCPECRVEAPVLKSGFDGLTREKIVGFRVNYKDPETDSDEKALADQFRIPYQHTKVIIKDGKEVARFSDAWDAATFKVEMAKY